jgi:pyridoxamine 5'-phosphate oxidase
MNLADLRENYQKGELLESQVDAHPMEQFRIWFQQAINSKILEPNAMFLSTLGQNNRIAGRIVLLKSASDSFTFFTNYFSKKGGDLSHHPQAALTFFWGELERQIRIEGHVQKLDESLSEAYFQQRPRASQIGAWVSEQSSRIESREILEQRYSELNEQYEGKTIPKPEHWGGYELIPDYMEFWQGRSSRLHDRIIYELLDGKWEIGRLAP